MDTWKRMGRQSVSLAGVLEEHIEDYAQMKLEVNDVITLWMVR